MVDPMFSNVIATYIQKVVEYIVNFFKKILGKDDDVAEGE